MEFLNERINSIKWDKTDVFYGKKDLLPLWVADMDIKSPKELLDNLNELTKREILATHSKEKIFINLFLCGMKKDMVFLYILKK